MTDPDWTPCLKGKHLEETIRWSLLPACHSRGVILQDFLRMAGKNGQPWRGVSARFPENGKNGQLWALASRRLSVGSDWVGGCQKTKVAGPSSCDGAGERLSATKDLESQGLKRPMKSQTRASF